MISKLYSFYNKHILKCELELKNNKYLIYKKENLERLCFILKDKEFQTRLCPVVNELKNEIIQITVNPNLIENIHIGTMNYGSVNIALNFSSIGYRNRVYAFFVDIICDKRFKLLEILNDKKESLKLLSEFVKKMEERGLVIDENILKPEMEYDFLLCFYKSNKKCSCYDKIIWYENLKLYGFTIEQDTLKILDNTIKNSRIVYEDEYAKYYKLSEYTSIKVYKEENVDLDLQEKNIEVFLKIKEHIDLAQNLFLPVRKVVSMDNKFIGYEYKTVDFDSSYPLSAVPTDKILKAMIVLCSQTLKLEKCGMFFYKNPCNSLFLNPNYKNQIQILNIDFLQFISNCEMIKYKENYILNYVKNSILTVTEDTFLLVDNIEQMVIKLKEILPKVSYVCKIHNTIYIQRGILVDFILNKKALCPVCKKNLEYLRAKNESIYIKSNFMEENELLFEGGESYIYKYNYDSVLKIFKNDVVDINHKMHVLTKLLKKYKILESLNFNNEKISFVIPQKIVYDFNYNVRGYIMKKIEDASPITLLRDKQGINAFNFNINDVIEILIRIGEGIELLHKEANIFIGDLNGKNILFDSNKNIYFLDFDGMGIDDDVKPTFFTDGYVHPIKRSTNSVSKEDDWYAFAIHVFYYLTYVHPFSGICYDDNGNIMNLEERMIKGISLIGNHDIKIPSVARSFEFMEGELKDAFMRIFEKGSRENITPYLKKNYKRIISNFHSLDGNRNI